VSANNFWSNDIVKTYRIDGTLYGKQMEPLDGWEELEKPMVRQQYSNLEELVNGITLGGNDTTLLFPKYNSYTISGEIHTKDEIIHSNGKILKYVPTDVPSMIYNYTDSTTDPATSVSYRYKIDDLG